MPFCGLLIFFQNLLSGIRSQIGYRSGPRFCLIWVQSVCKSYEQMTKVGNPPNDKVRGYRDQPGVRPSVCLSVRRQKLVHSITLIPFEIL